MGEDDDRWLRLFEGGRPDEILGRVSEGDPLRITDACIQYMQEACLLVDLDRLIRRSMARVAHAAPRYRGEPILAAWIRERLSLSMSELVAEDEEEERAGIPIEQPWDPRYAFLAEMMGIEPAQARGSCVAFNSLPDRVRRAFFAVVVEEKPLNRYVAEGNGPPSQVEADLKAAFNALSLGTIDGYSGGNTEDMP